MRRPIAGRIRRLGQLPNSLESRHPRPRAPYNPRAMGGPLVDLIQSLSRGDMTSAVTSLIVIAVILLIAFPLHELAHALVADYFGDPTPRRAGRITLNPIAHLSLIGSLFFVLFGFGWATTPVNPYNFRGDYRAKHAVVALAGPVMNVLIALVFTVLYHVIAAVAVDSGAAAAILSMTCIYAVNINLFLALFNLIPLPPLDGGTILTAFASEGVRALYAQISQYGFLVLLVLSYTGLLSMLVTRPASELTRLLLTL
jgi:Zn-dependent protease